MIKKPQNNHNHNHNQHNKNAKQEVKKPQNNNSNSGIKMVFEEPIKVSKKDVNSHLETAKHSNQHTNTNIDIYQESFDLLEEMDPHFEMSKEMLIEKLEIKRDELQLKIEDSDDPSLHKEYESTCKLLTNLNLDVFNQKWEGIKKTRKAQEEQLAQKKMDPVHFKSKIDLTCDRSEVGVDEQLNIFVTGKKIFKNMNYQKPPSELKNPFAKNGTRGNKPLPREISAYKIVV